MSEPGRVVIKARNPRKVDKDSVILGDFTFTVNESNRCLQVVLGPRPLVDAYEWRVEYVSSKESRMRLPLGGYFSVLDSVKSRPILSTKERSLGS